MKTKLFFLILILAQSLMSQKAIESKTFQWTKHTVEDFTFSYPNTWEINQKKAMGTSFIIFSHLEDKNDSFRDNVNLIVQDISSYNLNLDLYTELSIEQIKNLVTNSNLELSKRYGNFHEVIYTGQQGKFKLKFKQRFWVINNKAYVLTLTTEQDKWEYYQKVGNQILEEFKLLSK